MLQPVYKDHESCCPNCGCVLGIIPESHEKIGEPKMETSSEVFLLGSAMENVKDKFPRTSQQHYEEKALKQLILITKEFGLPDCFAIETFQHMKKKRGGFRSESEPIKQLLRILSKDDNYLYIHKMRAIKSKYETLLRM